MAPLNELQFQFHRNSRDLLFENTHSLEARTPEGKQAGEILWKHGTGEVANVYTHPDFRGNGLATHLWDSARAHSAENKLVMPQHSSNQLNAGKKWAAAEQARPNRPEFSPGQKALFPRWEAL